VSQPSTPSHPPPSPGTVRLRLHPRPFLAIREGRKTVEVRADKNPTGPQALGRLAAGDALVFTNTQTGETPTCRVQRVTHYRDVRALLLAEGVASTLSFTADLEDGVRSIECIADRDPVEPRGVLGGDLEGSRCLGMADKSSAGAALGAVRRRPLS